MWRKVLQIAFLQSKGGEGKKAIVVLCNSITLQYLMCFRDITFMKAHIL